MEGTVRTSCFCSFHHRLVTFHGRTWTGILFFFWGDWVQRPFNQRFGQEATDGLDVDAHHRKAGWAANMGSIVVVRRSTEDVVCLFMLLAVQMCMITVFCLFLPYSLWEFLIRFKRYSLGPEKQTSDYVGDVSQQGIASSYHALICAEIRWMRFWPRYAMTSQRLKRTWRTHGKYGGAV